MQSYVALVADMTGRYAHVYGTAIDWPSFVDQLEGVGCEVIENQSMDYEPLDELTLDELHEYDVVTVQELTTHTDAVLARLLKPALISTSVYEGRRLSFVMKQLLHTME